MLRCWEWSPTFMRTVGKISSRFARRCRSSSHATPQHNLFVHFLGKRADIPDVLSSLDAFVLSSRWEGSPIAVMEAMMIGIPVVLSDIGPLKDVSSDGKYAVLFRSGDQQDLASKLIQLVEDAESRSRLAVLARQWAMSTFSIEAHIASLLKLYGSLVK